MRVVLAAAVMALAVAGASAVGVERHHHHHHRHHRHHRHHQEAELGSNAVQDDSTMPRFAEARHMAFAADGTLFCRGKQCPLTRTAAGEPLCCPTTDHCCPATYKCDESDANSVKCVPTAATPTATGSSGDGSSVTVGGDSNGSGDDSGSDDGSDASGDDGSASTGDATDADSAASAGSSDGGDDGAGSGSTGGAGGSPPSADAGSDASSESSDEALPKFRQNIIIVKNINVLTKMNQNAGTGGMDVSSGSDSDESSSDEESSS